MCRDLSTYATSNANPALFYTKSILLYSHATYSTFDTTKIFVLNMFNCTEDIKKELEGLTARCREL